MHRPGLGGGYTVGLSVEVVWTVSPVSRVNVWEHWGTPGGAGEPDIDLHVNASAGTWVCIVFLTLVDRNEVEISLIRHITYLNFL